MKRKEQYADEIIEMLERTKCGAWASNINLNTKDRVIEVCQNVVDSWSGRKFKNHCTTLPQTLEQEPCEDAISRQSAIFLASDLKQDLPDDERIADMVMAHNEGILEYQTQLSLLPPVTPQPKTGHWKHNKCDVCGASRPPLSDNYCPNCGAKMVEPQESEG